MAADMAALHGVRRTKPDEDAGTAYGGIVHVNGRCVAIPKAWRALGWVMGTRSGADAVNVSARP
jgi:hypothetical protein